MPQKLRVLASLLVVFLTALACGQACPTCNQLREERLKECQALYGSGAQLGPCYANVPADIADDVAEAMDFMGAIVDDRRPITDGSGRIALFSRGYRAHGF